nr:copia protein [Tanacetum cinerariifolium]
MAVRDFKKFFKRRGRFVRQPQNGKKTLQRSHDDKNDKNQRAFVGGSWSDSGKEDEENVKKETCLVSQASSEVCFGSSYFSDENSSIDDLVLDNEYDKLCKMSLKIITKNKRLKATRNSLENELRELKDKLSTLEKNKGVDLECTKCQSLKIENEKLKEEALKLTKFENSTHCLNKMLINQKPSGDKFGLGFNSFEASSSKTKEIKFMKAQKKASSDGGPIYIWAAPIVNRRPPKYLWDRQQPRLVLRVSFQKYILGPRPKHMIVDNVKVPVASDDEVKQFYKPLSNPGVGFSKPNFRCKTPPPRRVNNNYSRAKTWQPKRNVGRKYQPHSFPIFLGVDLKPDEWIKDIGCSKHMTGNRNLFSTYKAYNGGNVIFGSNLSGSIIGQGQICDKKCRVTFFEHDSEIIKDGKVIGRASKKLVRNLPKLKFDQYFCDACKIGKQAHASHKAKNIVSTTRCLKLLHMDLFSPSAVRSYGGNRYTLVIVDDYSRKIKESLNVTFDETSPPSKISPLVDDNLDEEEAIKVTEKKNLENVVEDETLEIDKIVNIKEYRNHPLENVIGNLNQRTLRSQPQNQSNFFCFISTIEPKNVNEALTDESWIVAMQKELDKFIANYVWELVPQPMNMTIIGTKWKQTALAISTTETEYVSAEKACQQALWMKQALIDYVPIMKIKESLNVTFDETSPPSKISPLVDDDLDEEEAIKVTEKKNLENVVEDETLEIDKIVNIKESRNHPLENVIGNLNQRTLRSQPQNQSNFFCFISTIEPKNVNEALTNESWIVAMQEELDKFIANYVWELVPQPMNMKIIGTKWGTGIKTIVYADSGHAGDYVDQKSTSGICTFVGYCLTYWFSKKQTALAISTTEAEYVCARKACQQAWMKQALIDYDVRLGDVPIMCDKKGATDLSKNPMQHSRTKHIEIRHHFLCDNVQKGHISIEKVPSVDNIADILMKLLKRESFNYLRLGLGMMKPIP